MALYGRGINAKELKRYWYIEFERCWSRNDSRSVVLPITLVDVKTCAEANLIAARKETIAASSENWMNMWVEIGYLLSTASFAASAPAPASKISFSSILNETHLSPPRRRLWASPLHSNLRARETHHNANLFAGGGVRVVAAFWRLSPNPTSATAVHTGDLDTQLFD